MEFDQNIGWRTDDLLIIGQIVSTQTHVGDAPSGIIETFDYKRAVMNDVGFGGLFTLGSPLVPTGILTQGFFKYWGEDKPHSETPKGPFSSSHPDNDGAVLEKHRFWAVNYMLNLAPDSPLVEPTITATQLPGIVSAKQYRILHHYQIKFQIGEVGKINPASIIEIQHEANKGLTKIVGGVLSDFRDAIQSAIGGGTVDWGPILQIRTEEPEGSPNHDARSNSSDGKKQSNFASARIGEKGRNVNWRLFGKDAPWIFSEIIHELKSDGSVEASHKFSVDITWKNGEKQGETPFNNLNIYKRKIVFNQDGSIKADYEREDLLPMEGELKPFVDSASGQWPEPPIPPSVQ